MMSQGKPLGNTPRVKSCRLIFEGSFQVNCKIEHEIIVYNNIIDSSRCKYAGKVKSNRNYLLNVESGCWHQMIPEAAVIFAFGANEYKKICWSIFEQDGSNWVS